MKNVVKLGGAWLKGLGAATRTPPVVADGMLFISDATTIYALDPKTGDTIWQYKPERGAPARGGVALGRGLVFSGLSDSRIVALEERTGKLVWTGYTGNAPLEIAVVRG
jgi:quinohemoprotein ethanol dehydrogenase